MRSSGVSRLHDTERGWTAHLATDLGAAALLEAVGRAPLPEPLPATLEAVRSALVAGIATDELGDPVGRPSVHVTHQLHVDGRYPDLVVHDLRGQVLAVVEAQRGRVDDKHIAKLATRYLPETGARLGILVAEGWDPRRARHPAWVHAPAPVVVVLGLDALHELDYEVAWTHLPRCADLA